MGQRCGNARIDPAVQAEDHALLADLVPNFSHRLLQIIVHRPIAAASANVMDKVADDFRSARRVHNFGMKLQAKKLFATMLHRCVIRVVCGGDALETRWQLRQFVAVRVPDLQRLRQRDKQRAGAITHRK